MHRPSFRSAGIAAARLRQSLEFKSSSAGNASAIHSRATGPHARWMNRAIVRAFPEKSRIRLPRRTFSRFGTPSCSSGFAPGARSIYRGPAQITANFEKSQKKDRHGARAGFVPRAALSPPPNTRKPSKAPNSRAQRSNRVFSPPRRSAGKSPNKQLSLLQNSLVR